MTPLARLRVDPLFFTMESELIMRKQALHSHAVEDVQVLALHQCISVLMKKFRIEPGLLAGSVYADLHANDIGLLGALHGSEEWNVRGIAKELSAPISTISSALDRLEQQGLLERRRIADDRRVVQIQLTKKGRQLANRIQRAHLYNCRGMLARLGPDERREFLRLATQVAGL